MNRTKIVPEFLPDHGGDIQAASEVFDILLAQWIDLSTGINPNGYPIPPIPQAFFSELPCDDYPPLLHAAKAYYQVSDVLPGAGSQVFIETIPRLIRHPCRVAIPDIGYQEHRKHWLACGHQVVDYDGFNPQSLSALIEGAAVDCAVVINPNNPTAATIDINTLNHWRQQLLQVNGLLIVDEAFTDCEGLDSALALNDHSGMIVLRSLGKFFGLAGLRVGFALGDGERLQQLKSYRSLWSISGVSQYVATCALADRAWQLRAQRQIAANRDNLYQLLSNYFPTQQLRPSSLFVSLMMDRERAIALYLGLAHRGILLRYCSLKDSTRALLRFGLPAADNIQHNKRFVAAMDDMVEGKCPAQRKQP
ncbi:MAG: cobalamin biosynthetic protein CobC [Candidatus Pseudothioglobus sp.]